VERYGGSGEGVRHEWNEVWWQEIPKSRAYVGADHRTGLQQRTVGLDLGEALPHTCVGHGRGIGRTLHGDILNVNGNQQGRWEYPEQRHSPVISLKSRSCEATRLHLAHTDLSWPELMHNRDKYGA
jgi:hypothetical protein